MKRMTKFLTLTAAVVVLAAVFTSCDSIWNSGNEGTLTVLLTDAPFPADLVAEAIVVIDSMDIRAKEDGNGDGPFITLSRERGAYDLMDLRNGITTSLVNLDVPTGRYDLVRLFVDSAYVVLKEVGTTYDLRVPSGHGTGLKVFIRPEIEVIGGITSELLIDIDVSKSLLVQRSGQSPNIELRFTFKPVIRAVNQSTAGQLVGTVGTVADTSATANPIPDAQVWVWSVEADSVISNTFTDTLTGDYQLIGLPAGFYTAYATVAGHDTVSFTDVEIIAATATPQDFALTPKSQ